MSFVATSGADEKPSNAGIRHQFELPGATSRHLFSTLASRYHQAMGSAEKWMLRATLLMFVLLLLDIMIGHVPS